MTEVLVLGAGGFIGSHLVKRLKADGCRVRGVDLKLPVFGPTLADEFLQGDLRINSFCREAIDRPYDEVYQLAADMGGAGFVFSGHNDADIMHNSAVINLNVADLCREFHVKRIFYSSSACMYPEYNQLDPLNPICSEDSAYPANPDSEYGWEKLFSERLYMAYRRNYGLKAHIARYHNIFGPEGTWDGGREKAPAAICRKIAEISSGGDIEVWGDGEQTRSFLYVDECVEGSIRLLRSEFTGPVNVGSAEMVTINQLVDYIADIAGKRVIKQYIEGPQGVRGRTSDNRLIQKKLNWKPSEPLQIGLEKTYSWIQQQISNRAVAG